MVVLAQRHVSYDECNEGFILQGESSSVPISKLLNKKRYAFPTTKIKAKQTDDDNDDDFTKTQRMSNTNQQKMRSHL